MPPAVTVSPASGRFAAFPGQDGKRRGGQLPAAAKQRGAPRLSGRAKLLKATLLIYLIHCNGKTGDVNAACSILSNVGVVLSLFKMRKEGESGTGECRGSDSRGQKCSGRALLPEHAAIYTGNEPFNRHWGEGGIRRSSGGWSPADARGGAGTKNRRR